MPLKNLISMNAVFLKIMIEKAFRSINEPDSLKCYRVSCAAVTITIFHVVSFWRRDNKFLYRVPRRI